jgi:UDP-N-acetylmuramate--alanine ligase
LGANYKKWSGGARYGKGNYFVTEADEFFDNFLNYHPEIIILNNIEFDHPDYFKSEKQVFESFRKFIGNLIGEKVLIVNYDDGGVKKILEDTRILDTRILKYSPKKQKLGFDLRALGEHNVANALGVVALAKYLKIKDEVIKKSLESFAGIGRRMELISGKGGIKVYDDYAHHPTAIKATIEAIRGKYPHNRLWVVVEPHGYARTHALLRNYQGVFERADKVIIGPIFKARDNETFGIIPKSVVEISGHLDILTANSLGQIVEIIKKDVRKGDIILVMGAGKSNLWAKEICNLKI